MTTGLPPTSKLSCWPEEQSFKSESFSSECLNDNSTEVLQFHVGSNNNAAASQVHSSIPAANLACPPGETPANVCSPIKESVTAAMCDANLCSNDITGITTIAEIIAENAESIFTITSDSDSGFLVPFHSAEEARQLGVPKTIHCSGRSRPFPGSLYCNTCQTSFGTLSGIVKDPNEYEWETAKNSQKWCFFLEHVRRKHRNLFQCSICGKKFGDPEAYYQHSFNLPTSGYFCLKCSYSMSSKMLSYFHMKRHHSTATGPLSKYIRGSGRHQNSEMDRFVKYTSEKAAIDLGVRQRLRCDGLRTKQNRLNRIYCGICAKGWSTVGDYFSFTIERGDTWLDRGLSNFWNHIESEHVGRCPEPFQCFTCKQGFANRIEFVKHSFRFPPTGYCCVDCRKSEKSCVLLLSHICDVGENTQDNLSSEIRLDSNWKECDVAHIDLDKNRLELNNSDSECQHRHALNVDANLASSSSKSIVSAKPYKLDHNTGKLQCLLCDGVIRLFSGHSKYFQHYQKFHKCSFCKMVSGRHQPNCAFEKRNKPPQHLKSSAGEQTLLKLCSSGSKNKVAAIDQSSTNLSMIQKKKHPCISDVKLQPPAIRASRMTASLLCNPAAGALDCKPPQPHVNICIPAKPVDMETIIPDAPPDCNLESVSFNDCSNDLMAGMEGWDDATVVKEEIWDDYGDAVESGGQGPKLELVNSVAKTENEAAVTVVSSGTTAITGEPLNMDVGILKSEAEIKQENW